MRFLFLCFVGGCLWTWDGDDEAATDLRGVGAACAAAMGDADLLHQRKSESCSAAFRTVEGFKNMVQRVLGNTGAGVGNLELDHIGDLSG